MNVVLKLSKLCNLRCTYCYEYEHLANPARMPLEGQESFFRSLAEHLSACDGPRVVHFALHGGEPLLLPPDYLREVVALQQRYLGAHGISWRNSVQTNLYRVKPGTLALCEELDIGIGVSLDVHGDARVDAKGRDAEVRVKQNLLGLVDSGLPKRLRVGGISVLHAGNAAQAADTFRFFAGLGLDYRILPIFSMSDPPARMRHLMLEPAQVVAALQAVFLARLSGPGARIKVYPLEDYFDAAVRQRSGLATRPYDPTDTEWALIVDTNGDVYSHSEAYTPKYCLGNAFRQPLAEVLDSPARHNLKRARSERGQTCKRCEFERSCSRIPMLEAVPSERVADKSGTPVCAVAQPMIAWIFRLISQLPSRVWQAAA